MPSTSTVTSSGNSYINGVLSGVKWGVTNLTYSFPTSASNYGTTAGSYGYDEELTGFKAFTDIQQAAVTKVLAMYSAVANVTFTLITESDTVHADLRYAESDVPSTAWAYYPTTLQEGGDAWFGNSTHWYDTPTVGTYAFASIIHETGHAMGLKHPQDVSGSFAAMPTDKDSLEYSVMSYRSYIGASTSGGYTNGSYSYPQTLMMYDIAALQYMYGANYTTNATDSVYTWNATTGEMSINGVGQGAPGANKVFMTIWDGGGNDTYDMSNYSTGVTINLNPGNWSITSSTQLANLSSSKTAVGNVANALLYNNNTASLIENAIGGSGADKLTGNQADNKLTGNGGNDTLDGGTGNDTAIYSGASTNYSVVKNSDGSYTVTDLRSGTPDGTDKLTNIEYLQFTDKTTTLTTTTTPIVTNTAPVAVADSYSTAKNTKLTVTGKGVLTNDTDVDGNTLTAKLISGVKSGTLSFNTNGTFTYTPAKNYTGTVTFTYQANDGQALSSTVTVTIAVGTTKSGVGRAQTDGALLPNVVDDQMQAPSHKTAFADTDGAFDQWKAVSDVSFLLDHSANRFGGVSSDPGDDSFYAPGTGLPDLLHHHTSDFVLA